MKRPELNEIPVKEVFESIGKKAQIIVTCSEGQWDRILERAYAEGAVLLELDNNETPVKAYQRLSVYEQI